MENLTLSKKAEWISFEKFKELYSDNFKDEPLVNREESMKKFYAETFGKIGKDKGLSKKADDVSEDSGNKSSKDYKGKRS